MTKSRKYFAKRTSSLRAKFALVVIITLVTVLGVLNAFEYWRDRENSLQNLSILSSQIGRVIENDLQHQMLESDLEGVQESLVNTGNLNEIERVYLIDLSNRVIFSSEGDIGLQLNKLQAECQICHRLPPTERPLSIVVTLPEGNQVFRSMQPIENDAPCQECHDPDTRLLGMLLTDVSIAPYQAEITASLRENLWWSGGAILLTVILVIVLLNQFVIRRLERLALAITSFGHGDLHAPIHDETTDEIGKISMAFDDMALQVETREADNRALSDVLEKRNTQRGDLLKRLITAQENERKRVARELHDDLGQTLGGMSFHVKAIERSVRAKYPKIAEQLNPIRNMIKDATDKMYDLIIDLRPSSLDDFGLVHALRSHADLIFRGNGVSFELDTEKFDRRLSPEIETALFRVFQEALNNVVRHAEAQNVAISLACYPETFEGNIDDDGVGFDTQTIQPAGDNARGLGLLGMQERVMQCGGQINIQSRLHEGTHISIVIPLEDGCD